jgi:hypothetical protein
MEALLKILNKIQDIVDSGNSAGIPLPLARDPKNGRGSVSLTLVFLSFNLVFFGLIGKVTRIIGDVDMTNALWLFGICTSLYFGRKISKDGNKVNVEGKDENA